jgi:hypothetical protein
MTYEIVVICLTDPATDNYTMLLYLIRDSSKITCVVIVSIH